MVDVPRTFGALLIGAIVAASFSGVVTVQTFAYFKYYPSDSTAIKTLVFAVWFLDVLHTVFVSTSLWDHFIAHFGDAARIDFIPWSLALTIAVTAILTFLVHCFLVRRIYKLSHNNMFIAAPIGIIAALRLCFACLTTVKMITLRSLKLFIHDYTWSFTIGLVLSSFLDVIITSLLCFFLMVGRKQNVSASIHHILDNLMLYAFENGLLTSTATFVSLICWLVMPSNLIFMALHFVISKFYANSLLATLNTRKELNHQQFTAKSLSLAGVGDCARSMSKRYSHRASSNRTSRCVAVRIKVEETTIQVDDSAKSLAPPSPRVSDSSSTV